MRTHYLFCFYFGGLLFHAPHVGAHSAEQLKAVFDQTPIPEEISAATKALGDTAGMNSIREAAHIKQHELLEQHLRALADRKCRQSITNLAVIDGEIIDVRDKGLTEVEQTLRERRDATAAFIEAECTEVLVKPSQTPDP